MKKIFIALFTLATIKNVQSQNVGIGTSTPAYKLDVAGRVRIQQNGSQTAGIYFDGTTISNRAFIGMINDSHVGIYGGGGTGWNFAMNVLSGNIGMGTAAPTATLDVNGTMRYRNGLPAKGSVLVSNDASGNAAWKTPVAFKAFGTSASGGQSIETSGKIFFGTTVPYNLGSSYQPFLSQFIVPEKGVYNLTVSLVFGANDGAYDRRIFLYRSRNGQNGVLFDWSMHSSKTTQSKEAVVRQLDEQVTYEGLLEPGDLIWVEVLITGGISTYTGNSINTVTLINTDNTFFAGHLVARM